MPGETVAARLAALFAGRADAHGTHDEPVADGTKWAIKPSARTIREPVTLELWRRHLSGERPLGIVPIREDSTCQWGSIDDDDYERDYTELVYRAEALGFPLVPCRSKSGGLHLFLFLTEPAMAATVQGALRSMAARLGLAGCEIFPKQSRVATEHGDIGNWMVMPYFGSTFDGKIREQVGVKKNGGGRGLDDLTLEEFLDAAEAARQTPEQVKAVVPSSSPAPARPSRRRSSAPASPFADGPPCLQHLSQKKVVLHEGQSNFLLMAGIYYKKVDADNNTDTWRDRLEEANQTFLSPQGSAQGLVSIIKSLEKKDYEYTCKVEPMCSHCDSALCRTRRHGVGSGNNLPPVTGLRQLASEPPLWFVDIEGADKVLKVSTEHLMVYSKFQIVCGAELGKFYSPMKQADWIKVLNQFERTVIEAEDTPPDVRPNAQFADLLSEFFTNRAKAQRRDDLSEGRPWKDDELGCYEFTITGVEKFLESKGVRGMTRPAINERIKELGGKYFKQVHMRSGSPRVWRIPVNAVEHARVLELPHDQENPI